ncbi:MAG: hypothetical protein KDD33_07395 [Bdellovibrionales bacterium]|nr:hypothetical protein [Bdellovibrionales bacterium]
MCGIFGIVDSHPQSQQMSRLEVLKGLMEYSQARGRDATGIASWTKDGIHVLKRSTAATRFSQLPEFEEFVNKNIANGDTSTQMIIGNCRLVTAGDDVRHENNQPLIDEQMVIAHNGLIVNSDHLYKENPELHQDLDVDTEILTDLFSYYLKQGKSLAEAASSTFQNIRGSASIALFPPGRKALLLGTNNGSLYYRIHHHGDEIALVFSSEAYILERLALGAGWQPAQQILPGHGLIFDQEAKPGVSEFLFKDPHSWSSATTYPVAAPPIYEEKKGLKESPKVIVRDCDESLLQFNEKDLQEIKRCTQCILPETFPYIEFDERGVCNVCRDYKKLNFYGEEKLKEVLGADQEPKAKLIVALSGGRDSCYALHYLREKLDMPMVAYTYDWGAVTPLARRNMSLMCGELGIEHILVAADIKKKRENIRKNVEAWLKRPRLGTVPLFMAGDKQFFYYAQAVKNQNRADHIVFGMNPLEKTDFKVGFCGIRNKHQDRHYNLNIINQAKMISWYGKEFLSNPAYLNSSLLDTAFGYYSYYLSDHTYHILYQYIPWIEKEVNETLISKYDWEVAEDTSTTWRIGDGTASFYNYIYYTGAGFTESDTFRSNQIREGHITRDEAMKITTEENRPRFQSIQWYCQTMGLDFNSTIKTINNMPRMRMGH